MDVDEAGCHHVAGGVDRVPRRPGQARADGGNPVALDGHVGPPAGARAVDHVAPADEQGPGQPPIPRRSATDLIRSPCLMPSTCSMPELT